MWFSTSLHTDGLGGVRGTPAADHGEAVAPSAETDSLLVVGDFLWGKIGDLFLDSELLKGALSCFCSGECAKLGCRRIRDEALLAWVSQCNTGIRTVGNDSSSYIGQSHFGIKWDNTVAIAVSGGPAHAHDTRHLLCLGPAGATNLFRHRIGFFALLTCVTWAAGPS